MTQNPLNLGVKFQQPILLLSVHALHHTWHTKCMTVSSAAIMPHEEEVCFPTPPLPVLCAWPQMQLSMVQITPAE